VVKPQDHSQDSALAFCFLNRSVGYSFAFGKLWLLQGAVAAHGQIPPYPGYTNHDELSVGLQPAFFPCQQG